MSNESSQDDKNLSMLAHLLGAIFCFIPGLVIWLMNKDSPEKQFVNDQAKEALNFQITALIVFVAISALVPFLFFLVVPLVSLVWLVDVVFCIVAGVAASKGTEYRYPVALRLIK
jgi:uncharacterized Tic20 family protein